MLKSNLKKAWSSSDKVLFKDLADNTVLAMFPREEEMARVLERGPWTFQNKILLTKRWEPGIIPEELVMDKIQLWIQIHNLPIELMKDKFAKKFVEKIGAICKRPAKESETDKMKYLRYRVEIMIDSPLVSGFYLERPGKSPLWISFKYERLPEVCFKCGRLGHVMDSCQAASIEGDCEEWGPWLKAEATVEEINEYRLIKGRTSTTELAVEDGARRSMAEEGEQTGNGTGNREGQECTLVNIAVTEEISFREYKSTRGGVEELEAGKLKAHGLNLESSARDKFGPGDSVGPPKLKHNRSTQNLSVRSPSIQKRSQKKGMKRGENSKWNRGQGFYIAVKEGFQGREGGDVQLGSQEGGFVNNKAYGNLAGIEERSRQEK